MEDHLDNVYSNLYDYNVEEIQFILSSTHYVVMEYDTGTITISNPHIEHIKLALMTRAIDEYSRFYLMEQAKYEQIIATLHKSGCHKANINYKSLPEVCINFLKQYPKLIISTSSWNEILKDPSLAMICDPETNYDVHDCNDTRMIHTKNMDVYNLAIAFGAEKNKLPEDKVDPITYPINYALQRLNEIEYRLSKLKT